MELPENFDKAPPEKRRAVLSAGFVCFARDGYKKTAMSEIAAMAGVSKPSLFHYFGSKREMYLYLYRFACGEMAARIPAGTNDFFECLGIAADVKFAVMESYPGMYEFFFSMAQSDDAETSESVRQTSADAIKDSAATLFANVDYSRFKDGVDVNDAVEMVTALANGYLRGNADKSPGEIVKKFGKYLTLLKQAIYKEAYL